MVRFVSKECLSLSHYQLAQNVLSGWRSRLAGTEQRLGGVRKVRTTSEKAGALRQSLHGHRRAQAVTMFAQVEQVENETCTRWSIGCVKSARKTQTNRGLSWCV